jgi:hypothetical protein
MHYVMVDRGLYLEIRQLFVEFYTGSSSDRKRNIAILVLLVAIDISLVVVFCVTPLSDNLIASVSPIHVCRCICIYACM